MPSTATVANPVTGVASTPFVGGDPIETPTAPTPESRGDIVVVTPSATTAAFPDKPAVVEPATTTEPAAPATVATPAEPAAPAVAEPARDEKGKFIPKARFDEVNERRKAAEKELADRKAADEAAAKATENQYDFDAKEQEYIDLVLDGKKAEAATLRKEIRAAEQASYKATANQEAQTVTTQQTVKQQVEAVSDRYAGDYEQFNPESENYSEELVNTVEVLMAGYSATKRYASAAAALEAAILGALKQHDIPLKNATPPAQAAAPTAAAPARTAQSRVEAIATQPPVIAKIGAPSGDHGLTTIDVRSLSDAEFAKLPDETRRRLRGDIV